MHCYMAWFWLFIKVYKLVYDPPLMFGMANGQDNLPGAFRHRCREFHGCGSAAWHVLTGYGWLWFWDSVGGRVDLVGGFKHFLFPIIHGISRDNPSHWLIFFQRGWNHQPVMGQCWLTSLGLAGRMAHWCGRSPQRVEYDRVPQWRRTSSFSALEMANFVPSTPEVPSPLVRYVWNHTKSK